MPSTKKVKRILNRSICIVFSLIIIFSLFPADAFALDPVSTITMANAFAQAITAYGASHGVSMIFDVTNTSQIGENVHELWKRFRSGQQTIDDYMEIAAAIWPSLYNKVVDAGKAYVGIRLAAEYVSELDEFYNWLLSGPAELEKVDNQYYEWSLNEFDQVTPINVLESNISNLGNINVCVNDLPVSFYSPGIGNTTLDIYTSGQYDDYYITYTYDNNEINPYRLVVFSKYSYRLEYSNPSGSFVLNAIGNSGWYWTSGTNSKPVRESDVNMYALAGMSLSDLYYYLELNPNLSLDQSESGLAVAPYVGEASPDNVYIPDTDDPDYGPLPYFGPLNIPWMDVYGNGIDSLTDAQSEAITNKLDDVISQLKTLYLEGDGVLDNADTQFYDTFHSILPFTNLPSFRLNLSGIWHYVVSWVGTLSSWLTLMFQVWSNIPFQFSIPVYASAVVVIVLGVYKRFFM